MIAGPSPQNSTSTTQTKSISSKESGEPDGGPTGETAATEVLVNARLDQFQCVDYIGNIIRKHKPTKEVFLAIGPLYEEIVLSNKNMSEDMLFETAIQMLPSSQTPDHIAYNDRSPNRQKPAALHYQHELRNGAQIFQLGEYVEAIQKEQYGTAEAWLRKKTEANPNKLLVFKDRYPLLLWTIRMIFDNSGSPEQSIFTGMQMFKNAGYKFQFADLVSSIEVYARFLGTEGLFFAEQLASAYQGDVNLAFDYDNNTRSTNLVALAMLKDSYIIAEFWHSQGVDGVSNLNEQQHFFFGVPEYDENDAETQAVMNLLEAGVITYQENQVLKENLNQFLPEKNAQYYFDKFFINSLLPAEQEQQLQKIIATYAKRLLALQTNKQTTLPKECNTAYIKAINSRFNKIINPEYQTYYPYAQTQKQIDAMSKIESDFTSGEIDDSERITRLGELDFRVGQSMVDNLLKIRYFEQDAQKNEQIREAISEHDKQLLPQLNEAIAKGDFSLAKKLTEQFDSLNSSAKLDMLLQIAISTNQSEKIIASLLQAGANIEVRTLTKLARQDKVDMISALVQNGLAIDTGNEFGLTMLKESVEHDSKNVFKFLLKAGANIEMPAIGSDALDVAFKQIEDGYPDFHYVQRLLLKNKTVEESHRQALRDLLVKFPESTQKILDKYNITL